MKMLTISWFSAGVSSAVATKLMIDEIDKIYFIDGDLVSRPGPRITQGLEGLAEIIHPELFE